MLIRRQLLLAALLTSLFGTSVSGQDRVGSVLNTAGRVLGYGYGHGGYQAAVNHQMPVVRHRHPASQYPSRQLAYPYSPHYQPVRPHIPAVGLPAQQTFHTVGPAATTQSDAPEEKPVGPPPEWLKQYLKNNRSAEEAEEVPAIPERVGESVYSREQQLDERSSLDVDNNYQDSNNLDAYDLDAESDLLDEDMSPSDLNGTGLDNAGDLLNDAPSRSDALLEESGLDEADLESDLLDTDDFDLDSLDSELESDDLLDGDDDLLLMEDSERPPRTAQQAENSALRLTTSRRPVASHSNMGAIQASNAFSVNRRPIHSRRSHPQQPTPNGQVQATVASISPAQPNQALPVQTVRPNRQEIRHESSAPPVNRYRAPHQSSLPTTQPNQQSAHRPLLSGTSSILIR